MHGNLTRECIINEVFQSLNNVSLHLHGVNSPTFFYDPLVELFVDLLLRKHAIIDLGEVRTMFIIT